MKKDPIYHFVKNTVFAQLRGWILKRERYYGRKFNSKKELVEIIEDYIKYYNTQRLQRNLGVSTLVKKQEQCLLAA